MTIRSVFHKSQRTPEQLAELRAVREQYQREKPSLEEALALSGQDQPIPLGEVLMLHHVVGLLKKERERQKMTLEQLEAKTGISQSTLSRLETGKAGNPTIDTLYRVAAALGKVISCYLQDAPPSMSRACAV